jgi:hypothetical protein
VLIAQPRATGPDGGDGHFGDLRELVLEHFRFRVKYRRQPCHEQALQPEELSSASSSTILSFAINALVDWALSAAR